MAYLNVSENYNEVIYSGDAKTRAILKINNIVVNDLDTPPVDNKISSIVKIHNIIKTGNNRFSLDNFTAQDLEIKIYDFDYSLYENTELATNEYNIIELSLATLTGTQELSTITEEIWETVPIGIFNIIGTPTTDKGLTTIKAKCNRIKFDIPYDAKPIIDDGGEKVQIGALLQDICLNCGVELGTELPFTNSTTEIGVYDNTINANIYVSYISELAGCIAVSGRDGKLYLIPINNDLYKHIIDVNLIKGQGTLVLGDSFTFDRVCYEFGVDKYANPTNATENTTIYINSANSYISSQGEIDNIYNSISGFNIRNMQFETMGNPIIDAWDIVSFTKDNIEHKTLANNTLIFNGILTQKFDTSIGTKDTVAENVTIKGTATQQKYVKTEIDRTNASLKIVAEEIEKLTDYIRNVGMTGNYLRLEETPESNGAINKLSIKGFELMPLYPGMTYPSEYTYPSVFNFYTLIFDTVNTFNNNPHYVYVNSPIPLQKIGSVHDELLIEQNKVKVIQRIGYDFINEQWNVLSTPITHELNDVLLPTFEDNTYIKVLYFDNLIFNAEYIIKNELTSNFATQLESKSQFKISQDEINSKVSKDNLISEINQTAEEVKIKADKIKLEGLVTANENFKILLDGSMEARNGTFSGDVTANNLYLNNGGRVISGEGLLTNLYFRSNGSYSSYSPVGFIQYIEQESGLYNEVVDYTNTYLDIYIPDNFTIVSANLILQHSACRWTRPVSPFDMVWGYSRNIKIHKVNAGKNYKIDNAYNILTIPTIDITEIPNALGSSSWTPSNTTGGTVETKIGIDIKNYLNSGHNILVAKSNDSLPSANNADIVLKTGAVIMTINIVGYMSY